MNHLPSPLPGPLIAGICGATMALVSAAINSMAAAALLDFRRSPISFVSDRSSLRRARILTIFFGILGTLLALVVMKHLGTLVQPVNTIFGIFGGPLLGIFGLGVLSRRANTPGALAGALAGALVGISVAFSGPWFGYRISFMWISFSSATTTLIGGWLASFLFAPPGKAAQNLVYRANRNVFEEQEASVS